MRSEPRITKTCFKCKQRKSPRDFAPTPRGVCKACLAKRKGRSTPAPPAPPSDRGTD